jgi:homogentisate 1,2-dioxygenase
MPFYQKHGLIPKKRHVVSRQANGKLYHEELVGTEGFAGMSSLVYHLHPPTMVLEMGEAYSVKPKIAVTENLKCLSFAGFNIQSRNRLFKK